MVDFYGIFIDIEAAKERFVCCEEVYRKHLLKFPYNNNYKAGFENIESGNVTEAFNEMHSLKGLSANLSLTDVYEKTCIIVEELRAGKLPDKSDVDNLRLAYDAAVESILQIEKNKDVLFTD